MSKRHKKTKLMLSNAGPSEHLDPAEYDLMQFGTSNLKGKKPKGRAKRASHKRAYYDD